MDATANDEQVKTKDLPDSSSPKRIAIFCDGTWNDLRNGARTNVARLAKSVRPTGRMDIGGGDREVPQVVYYDEGVGVGEGVSPVTDTLVRCLGGALGRGLDSKIEKAYRFLVLNYTPGDEIFIFGFSRGAYTARSLCGLIRNAGILRRSDFDCVPNALNLYRSLGKPHSEEAQAFRRKHSYDIIAGEEDYTDDDWELIKAFRKTVDVAHEVRVIPPEIRHRGIHIRYLGVWDTVGALGVPSRFRALKWLTSRRYRFHDHEASTLIASLRHALALDEHRAAFEATPFSNIDDLNLLWAATEPELQLNNPSERGYVGYSDRPYQQCWFPGDHGSVGGGGTDRGISSIALLWIAEGAAKAGLELDRSGGSELDEAMCLSEPGAGWPAQRRGTGLVGRIGGENRRLGPPTRAEVHPSAFTRQRLMPQKYDPVGLSRFPLADSN